MDNNKATIRFEDHYIDCPIMQGKRCAACCVYFDRYKGCRRHCASLNQHLKTSPTFMEEVTQYYETKKSNSKKETEGETKFFGQFLPSPELNCPYCKFIAKSARGLRVHLRRTHGKKEKNHL